MMEGGEWRERRRIEADVGIILTISSQFP